MKNLKKHAVSACLAALVLMSLAGCGADGSDAGSGSTSGTDYSNTTVTAQVQSIDGGSVTAIIGQLSERQGGGQGGPSDQVATGGAQQPPVLPKDSSAANGASPGAIDGQAPEGAPEGGRPGRSVFTADGESVSFEIDDGVFITVESADGSTDGSLSDIQTGAILEITFGNGNTVASVTVKSVPSGGPGGQAPEGAPQGTPGSDESDASSGGDDSAV